jgi:hypothetical protein
MVLMPQLLLISDVVVRTDRPVGQPAVGRPALIA